MDIIFAIPNFNGAANLKRLLDSVETLPFDGIYLLDDHSDDESLVVAEALGERVTVVPGKSTVGPGGNRNRILEHMARHGSAIILFCDADMEILEADLEGLCRFMDEHPNIGIVGGKILTHDQEPMRWNFGSQMNPFRDRFGAMIERVVLMIWDRRAVPLWIARLAQPFNSNLTIESHSDREVRTDWVAEGNFAIRGDLFRALNGFDEEFAYHEGQDLAKRAWNSGFSVIYKPFVKTVHHAIDTFGSARKEKARKAALRFHAKHGGLFVRAWLRLGGKP